LCAGDQIACQLPDEAAAALVEEGTGSESDFVVVSAWEGKSACAASTVPSSASSASSSASSDSSFSNEGEWSLETGAEGGDGEGVLRAGLDMEVGEEARSG
jgi:hypothetical protein